MSQLLHEIGETALIDKLTSLVPKGDAIAGPGDDCAVIDVGAQRLQLLKTDAVIEGVHFTQEMGAQRVGWKAVARLISDFAAMGGEPAEFLITVVAPASASVRWLEDFYRGAGKCMARFSSTLVGGETCHTQDGAALMFSIAATGWVEKGNLVLRSGGNIGDEIWVTGSLGGSFAGKHLDFLPRLEQAHWLVKNFQPSAMMDLSDGLAADLPKLAHASDCGFHINTAAIPLTLGSGIQQALNDGEDFELLFTLPRNSEIQNQWPAQFPNLKLSQIGHLVKHHEGNQLAGGWDHFRKTTQSRSPNGSKQR